MFEDMKDKWKKSLAVVKDLKELEFKMNNFSVYMLYTIKHPEDKYSIWVANGLWFTSIYEIDGDRVFNNHSISKFGALGKILVWWYSLPHIKRLKKLKKEREVVVHKFW